MVSTVLSSIGLFTDIVGAVIIFKNAPDNFLIFDGGTFGGRLTEEEKRKLKKNKRMKLGLMLMIFGFFLQLLGNFV